MTGRRRFTQPANSGTLLWFFRAASRRVLWPTLGCVCLGAACWESNQVDRSGTQIVDDLGVATAGNDHLGGDKRDVAGWMTGDDPDEDDLSCSGGESCDDGDSCTTDSCVDGLCSNVSNGSCSVCVSASQCSDGLFCTGVEGCANGVCKSGPDPCPGQLCDEAIDACVDCFGSGPCDDGSLCTLNDVCSGGSCIGTPLDCDDGDPCTDDSCDPVTGMCEHDPRWPYWTEEQQCSTYGCSGHISIGNTILPVNDDDDNGNGTPDLYDPGPVADENDLRSVSISLNPCSETMCGSTAADHWYVDYISVPWRKVYFDPQKTDPLEVAYPLPAPDEVFIEASFESSCCGDPVWGGVGLLGWQLCCGFETPPVQAVKVESLYWEAHTSNEGVVNPDLLPCPINGGVRIFPGLVDPNDQVNANTRSIVSLVAQVAPRIPGVTVRFRIWDVDDPFDQLYGPNHRDGVEEVPNVTVIDSSPLGNDNRGVAPGFSNPYLRTGTTDADGRATVSFSVSMQPGDNFRAAATCLPYVLSSTPTGTPSQVDASDANALGVVQQADQKYYPNGDFDGYQVPVVWSKMLTVWRKLHVETDTMVRPTFAQNTFTMNWSQPRTGGVSSVVLFEVADPPEIVLETTEDQFNGGYVELRDLAGNTMLTSKIQQYWTDEDDGDEDGNEFDQVRINLPDCGNGQSGLACLGGVTSGTAILSDDDLSVQATFAAKTWGCNDSFSGPVASLAPPDLSMMANRYNLAYIEPVHDGQASAVQGLVTFIRNWDEEQDDGKALWDQVLPARNLPVSTADFWTVMVVSAWQAEELQDADPDMEDQVGIGVTKGVGTHSEILGFTSTTSSITGNPGADYTGICAVFKAVFGEGSFLDYEKYTVVHEVGHTFGLDHRAGGAMCLWGDCQREPFQAVELDELRNYIQP